jgi:hypothetical protein
MGKEELLGTVAGITTPVIALGETRPPKLLVAVTIARIYLPTFVASNVYVTWFAPLIGEQVANSVVVQLCHWYVKVGAGKAL